MNWLDFWRRLREPLLSIHEYAPAVFLVLLSLGLELVVDRWVAPAVATRAPKAAAALTKGFNGLRAGIFAGGFAALTTLQGEYALLGAIAAVVTFAVRTGWSEMQVPRPPKPPIGPTALLVLLACSCSSLPPDSAEKARVAACVAESKTQTQREKTTCRAERKECLQSCKLSDCAETCKLTSCTQAEIDRIFADANAREAACLQQS